MKPKKPIETLILNVRGQKVILDADLAGLYGVPTKRLNEQVKRNAGRFPEDFLFQLTAEEFENLKSQIATSSLAEPQEGVAPNWSQFATASHGGRRKPPFAFTEHGAIMAATVLNSPEAVAMSVFVVRAFMQMREQLAANAAILKRLAEEFQCAQFLDALPEVKFWVRNLSKRATSFRLQTSKDWFYPDFLCQLSDGRVLVVEYKGKHLYDNNDAGEKRAVGAVWAGRSGGRCLFAMPTAGDFSSIVKLVTKS